MSRSIKSRLFCQLWESGNPIISATTRRRSPTSITSTYFDLSRKGFSHNMPKTSLRLPSKPTKHAIGRQFATSGVILCGFQTQPLATTSSITTYGTVIEKTMCATNLLDGNRLSPFSQQKWCRAMHSSSYKSLKVSTKRNKSSAAGGQNTGKVVNTTKHPIHSKEVSSKPDAPITKESTDGGGSYFHLPHMPKMPHRPTKEELLAAATGFWSRLKVRFKWFSIRSVRPWNIDDWSAFISWFVLGHIVWILVGTTGFVSLAILAINTVVAQETLARWVGDYLTQSAGVKVVFESAIVPKWGAGVITFHNVFVSRRPGHETSKVSKGSSMSAAAKAAAERQVEGIQTRDGAQEDGNYTQFDVTIDTVNVTLSFVKWWNGKGLLRDVEVKGVRGVVDRTSVHYGNEYIDPRTYIHEHNPGDFEINSFKMEDLLLTIYQPKGFRPFKVSIFNCELPQLRKQWLFYDILSANQMSGSFDGSLFTIHPHQTHSLNAAHNIQQRDESYEGPNPWKKRSRLRIDGLKIDHLNREVDGPFGWIYEGNVDIVADILFPADADESVAKLMSDFYDRMEATVTSNRYLPLLENSPHTADLDTPEKRAAFAAESKEEKDDGKGYLIMDLKVHLNAVHAAVPLFTRSLSYTNQALIRPIVAYINSRKTFIPISCRIVKRASEFDGSWTVFDSGLMEDLSAETYEAFAKDVVDRQQRLRRLKKVGFWSVSLAVQALFVGMAGGVA